ncbi:ABC transporter permease [Nakamurella leprariae]|uniref:ABC transporter permease n=1 Tax=Nakamurella leprariae TaxID=2803911 RepID=A0A939C0A9_9ACTN|nr:ABC transporter permease [Nakamurella leprariae]MBM9468566.1 ABC transporter permease [Nakamurella leprariae]
MVLQHPAPPATAAPPTPSPLTRRDVLRTTLRSPVTLRFVVTRVLAGIVAVWGAVSIVFLMIMATGNPAQVMASEEATQEEIDRIARLYGFDRPIFVQYLLFLRNLVTGEFPNSLYTDEPAFSVVLARVPATLLLSVTGVALGSVVGLLVGYWCATSRFRLARVVPMKLLMVLQSTPSFLLGLLLILFFAVTWKLLPTSGMGSWKNLVMPAVTLAAYVAPAVARLFRSTIREMEVEEHVATATAKGLRPRTVRRRHIAVNALGPVIALIGMQVGGILGGAVITEQVFAWPGVGQLLVNAVNTRDFPVALAGVILICVGFVVASLVVDLVVAIINPRSRA